MADSGVDTPFPLFTSAEKRMTWTLVYILVMVMMIIVLRLAAWWGLRLVSRLFSKSMTVFKQD